MTGPRQLLVLYDRELLVRARAGDHNFTNRLMAAFESSGITVRLGLNSRVARWASAAYPGYALFGGGRPTHARALSLRLAHIYPFWRIERSHLRWEWEIAGSHFDPGTIDPDAASAFATLFRKRIFGDLPAGTSRDGLIYIPLQGRLTQRRSFQSASPIDMIRETARRLPNRPIAVTLHPRERYSASEQAALAACIDRISTAQLVTDEADILLRDCAMVVTQNSSVALKGYFLHKPAVLFAKIDFHHIAGSVPTMGVEDAFHKATREMPEFDRYLFWFLQKNAINAGRDNAEATILSAVRRHGWDV